MLIRDWHVMWLKLPIILFLPSNGIFQYSFLFNLLFSLFNIIIQLILVGCKHRGSIGMFYIGGRLCVLCQFIEPVTFVHCAFIFALQNIALGGYLDTHRNI